MEEWGNGRANNYYESNMPEDVYRPIETDSVRIVDKFVRDKYEYKKYISKSLPPKKQNLQEVEKEYVEVRKPVIRRTRPKPSKASSGTVGMPVMKSIIKAVPTHLQVNLETKSIDLIDFNDEPEVILSGNSLPPMPPNPPKLFDEDHFKETLPRVLSDLINISESDFIDFGDCVNNPATEPLKQDQEQQQQPDSVRNEQNQQNIYNPSLNVSSNSSASSDTKVETFAASILSMYDSHNDPVASSAQKRGSSINAINVNGNSNRNNLHGSSTNNCNTMSGGMHVNRMMGSNELHGSSANITGMNNVMGGYNKASHQNGSNHSQYFQHQAQQSHHWQQQQQQQQQGTHMMQRGTGMHDKSVHQNYQPQQYHNP